MRIFYIQRTGEVIKEMCVDIDVDDSSYRYREIRSSNELTLYFSAPNFLEIPLGAWCEFQGERYTLEEPVIVTKHGEENYEYDVTMEGAQSMLKKFKFRHTLGINDTSDRSLKFDLTAKPRQHLQMLVDNLNSREGAVVWGDGRVLDSVEKHIAYNHTFCMDALNQMADAFDTEYEVVSNVSCDSVGCSTPNCEIIHKQIHLHKLEYNIGNNALSIVENGVRRGLTYGKDNGFVSGVHRTNYNDKKAVGCLFVQGGERNIDSSVYGKSATDSDQAGSSVLLLPKGGSIQFDGTHFDDEVGYSASTARTYTVDAHGYSVQRVETNDHLVSKVEDSLDLSDIYPTEEHTVTKAIPTVKNEGKEDEFTNWDIIDINNTVDYKDYRIDGQIATVIFQSGMLAGKEFDLVQDKTLHGYVHAERRFKLVSQDINGMRMPSEEGTAFTPKVGDKFKVFGVSLPAEYITKAERKMLKEAVKYLYENVDQKFTIDADIDGIWAKRNWENISGKIVLGGYVLFYDPDLHIEDTAMRIRSIKEYIHNPYKPQIELTNTIAKGSIMNDINKIKANEVVTESNRKEAQQFAKRGFRNAQETTKMLENSLIENFTESIKPITINTMQLLVGDESLQFQFVDKVFTEGQTAPVLDANHNIGYNASTKTLTADSGVVRHLSLDVKTMSPTHKAGEYKYWTIGSSFSITNANIVDENSQPDKSGRYLYIKAHRTAGTAEYVISDVAIAMNSDKPEHANHYHFTCGILNSETNGSRDYTSMFGFTEILPGRITTDKIVSADGETYFDLANGEIGGKITFLGGSSGLENLDEWDPLQEQISSANQAVADAVTDYNAKMLLQQAQIDGEVSNWFYDHTPALNNIPANGWDIAEKQRHKGDTFTNTQEYVSNTSTPDAGKSWRFVIEDGVYKWKPIADSDAVKALQEASKAQASADGKSTTFFAKPTKYQIGDSWILESDTIYPTKGKSGDILYSSADSSVYNATHWDKKLRYTDDTELETFKGVIIHNGLIRAEKINTDDLTVKRIKTPDGKIEIGDGKAIFGDLSINQGDELGASINIGDNVILKKREISALNTLTGGFSGDAKSFIKHNFPKGQGYGAIKSITIGGDDATLTINTKINASTSSPSGDQDEGYSGYVSNIEMEAFLLKNGSFYVSLGSIVVTAPLGGGYATESMTISESRQVDAGTYEIEISYHTQEVASDRGEYDGLCSMSINAGSIGYTYLDPIMITEVGRNGMAIVSNIDNYEYTIKGEDGKLTKTFKGKFDVPGVLCAGTVTHNGGKGASWGAKGWSVEKHEGQSGKYKITHDLGHPNYYMPPITPILRHDGWINVHGGIIQKSENWVIVGMFDTSTPVDYEFDFMIVGQN